MGGEFSRGPDEIGIIWFHQPPRLPKKLHNNGVAYHVPRGAEVYEIFFDHARIRRVTLIAQRTF
jgi:hypothetical protein